MYDRVPPELLRFRQFVCWNYIAVSDGKPTKVPFNPTTGQKASVTDPNSWVDYTTAAMAVARGQYNGIGFVLTEQDPYSFIDLDARNKDGSLIDEATANRQKKIFEAFDSYSERSPSGEGLHIIVKGLIPEGRRKGAIEVYSSNRYMTLTGDVFHDRPIVDRQELLTILFNEMGWVNGSHPIDPQAPETKTDEQVLNEGANLPNQGDRFKLLWGARLDQLPEYPSQSEADLAFIDMLAMLTQNRDQIRRIFMNSWLGQRDKAQKRPKYVEHMITKSFDRLVPAIDFEGFRSEIERKLNGTKESGANVAPQSREETPAIAHTLTPGASTGGNETISEVSWNVKPPPGLLGDIAKYIYGQSQRPVPEIALCAAIGLMAGVCGRSYNTPTGAGLNLYTVLIAKTGVGKETMASGISRLIAAVKTAVPVAGEFIGPAELNSSPAIMRRLEKTPSMLCILGEFGLLMQSMSGPRAASHMKSVRRILLDAYGKSGQNNIMRGAIYSDSQKNIGEINAPALSILSESTPSTFFEAINEDTIAEGFLSRLLIIEYRGDRVPQNPNVIDAPNQQLQAQFATLCDQSLKLMHQNNSLRANMTDEASELQRKFNELCDRRINGTEHETTRDLWSRAHLKALKLATLVAVGINPYTPLIDASIWDWSQELVHHDVLNIETRFKNNDVGSNQIEAAQLDRLNRCIKQYIEERKPNSSYGVNQGMVDNWVIPYLYFHKRLVKATEFNKGLTIMERGTNALRRALKTAIDQGVLYELKDMEKFDKNRMPLYGSAGVLYRILDNPGD